jgi:hypothetical protein
MRGPAALSQETPVAGAFAATVRAQSARRTVMGTEVIAKLAGHAEARRFDPATCL